MKRIGMLAIAGCLVVTWVASAAVARADSPAQQVDAALATLDGWLGDGENGDKWRTYLRADDLRQQLALGEAADESMVEQVLARFTAEAQGLESPACSGVRAALETWLAELKLPTAAELPEATLAAKATFVAVSAEELEASRQAALAALVELDTFLARGASGSGWKNYLLWPSLETELAKSEAVNITVLEDVVLRLGSGHPGLELPQFAALGDALATHLVKLGVAQDPQAQAQFEAELDNLAVALEAYPASGDPAHARAIGASLVWLEGHGQAPQLISAIRKAASLPNVYIQASEDLVGDGMERHVDEPTEFNEIIMGTDVYGHGRTVGDLVVELVPSTNYAAWDTVTRATTWSDNVGYNGKATIVSSSVTTFTARKRIFVTAEGLSSWCSVADACSQSCVHCVSSGVGRGGILTRIANNIAWKRVMQSLSQAEYEGARKAERRITRRIDGEGADRLSKSNANYYKKFRKPLLDENAFPPRLEYSTSSDYLYIVALQAGAGQLGALDSPPDLLPVHDFGVRVHESMIENQAALTMAGDTILEEEFDDQMQKIFGENYKQEDPAPAEEEPPPEEEPVDEEADGEGPQKFPWRMTMAEVDPVNIRFRDNHVLFTIRATKFQTKQEFNLPLTIEVDYVLEAQGRGFVGHRQGRVSVVPTDPNYQLNNQEIVLRNRIRRRFEEVFTETKTIDGLTLPGEWKKSGRLELVQLICDGGWMTTAWVKPTAPPSGSGQADPADPAPMPE